jgi:hypothetical protein
MLLELATQYPGAVHYVFPFIGDHTQLIEAAPHLTDETFYASVERAGRLEDPPTSHRVEVYRDRAIFHSEPVPVPGRFLPDLVQAMNLHQFTFSQFIEAHERLRQGSAKFVGTAPSGLRILEFDMPRVLFAPV